MLGVLHTYGIVAVEVVVGQKSYYQEECWEHLQE